MREEKADKKVTSAFGVTPNCLQIQNTRWKAAIKKSEEMDLKPLATPYLEAKHLLFFGI